MSDTPQSGRRSSKSISSTLCLSRGRLACCSADMFCSAASGRPSCTASCSGSLVSVGFAPHRLRFFPSDTPAPAADSSFLLPHRLRFTRGAASSGTRLGVASEATGGPAGSTGSGAGGGASETAASAVAVAMAGDRKTNLPFFVQFCFASYSYAEQNEHQQYRRVSWPNELRPWRIFRGPHTVVPYAVGRTLESQQRWPCSGCLLFSDIVKFVPPVRKQ
eukprot:scaffold27683_cov90-Isochrysis_galbana.AAC.2